MVKRVVFAAVAAFLFTVPARADHAVEPEAGLVPVVTQEICTTIEWGFNGLRTDCRTSVRAAPSDNPALKGICTTYYGRRTCY